MSASPNGRLTFTAEPGESNDVRVTFADPTVTFTDAAPVVATGSCTQVTQQRATCSYPSYSPSLGPQIAIVAGDGDDVVDMSAVDLPALCLGAEADGGAGDDVLLAAPANGCSSEHEWHGGPGNDIVRGGAYGYYLFGDEGQDVLFSERDARTLFFGGAGDDVISGGAAQDSINGGDGFDLVDYSDRSAPVFVDLSEPGDAGETGEHDLVVAVEDVIGGTGDDHLVGSDADNVLDGGPGADSLFGGAGQDAADYSKRLAAVSAVADGTPSSGNADDGVSGRRDTIAEDIEDLLGGAGDDQLVGNAGANSLFGLGGDDVLDVSGDGVLADSLSCGEGTDTAVADVLDSVAWDCEMRQGPAAAAAPPPLPPPARVERDYRAPDVTTRLPGKQRLRSVLRFGLLLAVSCSEACTVRYDLEIDGRSAPRLGLRDESQKALASGQIRMETAATRSLGFRINGRSLRRRISARGRADMLVSLLVRDRSENLRTLRRRIVVLPTGTRLLAIPGSPTRVGQPYGTGS